MVSGIAWPDRFGQSENVPISPFRGADLASNPAASWLTASELCMLRLFMGKLRLPIKTRSGT
jgi:hypothetical protein